MKLRITMSVLLHHCQIELPEGGRVCLCVSLSKRELPEGGRVCLCVSLLKRQLPSVPRKNLRALVKLGNQTKF